MITAHFGQSNEIDKRVANVSIDCYFVELVTAEEEDEINKAIETLKKFELRGYA